jgi:cyclic pyranopterin phosphate synthase
VIKDSFGRPLTSLRISITSRCNLNCIYCHHEGMDADGVLEMTPEEIARIAGLCVDMGLKKVKITGGEPLVRRDAVDVVEAVAGVDGIKEVSMTTNGSYLEDLAGELKTVGLDRVNVSIDTLNPKIYSWITGGGKLERVLSGISAAVESGLVPVKLNMVVMKGVNEGQVWGMINEFSQSGVTVQLIELMVADQGFFDKYYYKLDDLEAYIAMRALESRSRNMHRRMQYRLDGASVEVVRPMHNTGFCANCTRLRITADGRFKPCLMDSNLVDFLTPLRERAPDRVLRRLLMDAVRLRRPYFSPGGRSAHDIKSLNNKAKEITCRL